ncbi:CRISPR-associated helicase Cas3' [Kitasatospora sp. NPDC006697]|uniref:CRISPR-associated helicase Cas3' n=1 Tax=Kitasatospora sp. NPDC006697 TaxID=3364020 RepID=UPI00369B929B
MTAPAAVAGPLAAVLAKSATSGRAAEQLTAHLEATLRAAIRLRERVGRIEVAEDVLASHFWPAVELSALCHDGGKLPRGFQQMVRGRSRAWGERHEVVSLGFLDSLVPDSRLRRWVAAGVATHHRPLTGSSGRDLRLLYADLTVAELAARIGPVDDQAVGALQAWLHATAAMAGLPTTARPAAGGLLGAGDLVSHAHETLNSLLRQWDRRVDRDQGLAAVLLQGAVTLSDHLASAHGTLHTRQPLDHRFRPVLERQMADHGRMLREHQIRAAAASGDLLLRAPTGSGKTEAVLLWAARQVGEIAEGTGGAPRVFFTLPYLASINAMAHRLGELLGDQELVGVAHSRAASYHLAAAIRSADGHGDQSAADTEEVDPCRADEAAKALSRAAATKLFRESVRVGTPYQLLRGALAGPAHSSLLVDAANSVFILDELHAYDPRRLGYLLAAVRLWKRLGGRIAVVSATLPEPLADLFRDGLGARPEVVDTPDLGLPARHRLQIRAHHLTDPSAQEEIRRRIGHGESVLVVANNVAHALALFDDLAPHARARHGDDSAFLLHSRFTRADRDRIERSILARFGSTAEHRPGLLIATQVCEVSLDLDLDVLFTAAAPLEALLQRFGRVNRVGSRPPADVIVHAPNWTRRRGQAGEFADGVYLREPVEAAWHHLMAHHGSLISEAHGTRWLNAIYATAWGASWREEVEDHRDAFERALLGFQRPFADRSHLTETFDELFDGTEAVLEQDLDAYAEALAQGTGAQGRLLADNFLIPMPAWTAKLTRYEKSLNVRVIKGDYHPDRGLLAVHGEHRDTYRPGEVL